MPKERFSRRGPPSEGRPYTATANEADLSAEEAKARQDARFPGKDADARRTRDPEAPAAQRPEAPHPVEMAKRRRLSRSGEFDRVYRDGSSHATRHLVLYSFPRKEGDEREVRLGVSVSRRLGGAADRNRVKRALREAFWALADRLPARHDFVLVARPEIDALIEREGADGVRSSIEDALSQRPTEERST
jgi:ribonuclease P protein component